MAFPGNSTLIDGFNRANASTLGTPWQQVGTGQEWTISGNAAVSTLNALDLLPTTTGPDASHFMTLTAKPVNDGGNLSIEQRVSANSTTRNSYLGRWLYESAAADIWRIYRRTSGTLTQLGTDVTGNDLGIGNKFGMDTIGSAISVYAYNGTTWTQVATQTDTTYAAAGYVIFSTNDKPSVDDFSGGTVSAGGGTTTVNIGKVASGQVVHGLSVHGSGAATVPIGKIATLEHVYGLSVTHGNYTIMLGKIPTLQVVHGLNVHGSGAATLTHGKVASSEQVYGLYVGPPIIHLSVGRLLLNRHDVATTGTTGTGRHAIGNMAEASSPILFVFEVESVGATPTVTFTLQGVMNEGAAADWQDINYVTGDSAAAAAKTAITKTTTGKTWLFVDGLDKRFFDQLAINVSANTNVTYSVRAYFQ